jgi:hypothetical protein
MCEHCLITRTVTNDRFSLREVESVGLRVTARCQQCWLTSQNAFRQGMMTAQLSRLFQDVPNRVAACVTRSPQEWTYEPT